MGKSVDLPKTPEIKPRRLFSCDTPNPRRLYEAGVYKRSGVYLFKTDILVKQKHKVGTIRQCTTCHVSHTHGLVQKVSDYEYYYDYGN